MTIVGSIARVVARSRIGDLFDAGYSANQGLALLRMEGIRYRRQTFLRDWRELTGIKQVKNVLKYIPRTKYPTLGVMTPKASDFGYKYVYRFNVSFFDPAANETVNQFISVGSDRKLTMQDAEERLLDYASQSEFYNSLEYESFERDAILVRV